MVDNIMVEVDVIESPRIVTVSSKQDFIEAAQGDGCDVVIWDRKTPLKPPQVITIHDALVAENRALYFELRRDKAPVNYRILQPLAEALVEMGKTFHTITSTEKIIARAERAQSSRNRHAFNSCMLVANWGVYAISGQRVTIGTNQHPLAFECWAFLKSGVHHALPTIQSVTNGKSFTVRVVPDPGPGPF